MKIETLAQIVRDNVDYADEDMIETAVFAMAASGKLKELRETDVQKALDWLQRHHII